ncbi:hypothetical protein PoB_002230500 [Plakobranchus ocellatus]|uniref:Uncharacterized protein n=1 Tax=Plakobranchus ocellatus TaxID=259542 RepID=A0AAV3ZMM3_9GAST|nr:hypothetical protein PoB_002230500 [Plakobranchus ocellatus]
MSRASVAERLASPPSDLQGPFCRGFEPHHRRPSLTGVPESLRSPCCGLAIHKNKNFPMINDAFMISSAWGSSGTVDSEYTMRSPEPLFSRGSSPAS